MVQGLANSYGMSPSITKRGTYHHIHDVVESTDNYGYFCRKPSGECAYRFVEHNPHDQERKYPLFTNRTITASAGQCFTYLETEKATPAKDTSGILDALEYKISNGSAHDNMSKMLLHTSIKTLSPHRIRHHLLAAIDAYGCGLTNLCAMVKNPPFTSVQSQSVL